MNTIEESIQQLEGLHQKRLRVSFEGLESHLEQKIENLSARINECINRVSMKIKEIAIVDTDNLTEADKNIRKGMMQSIGIQLHDIVLRFRSLQRNFVIQIKAQDLVGTQNLTLPSSNSPPPATADSTLVLDSQYALEDAFDIGLTQEQEAQIRDLEEYADAKEKEIIHLVQSINELSSMFQELNVLVIEQGTILDRIDYNVMSTLERVQKGTVELQHADRHSKHTITMRAILVLVCVIMCELLILVFKHRR
uniref:Syntaxin-41 n=1 Tax=Lygus hesperus TaxID=30085 RepID=A0A0A9YXS5_LYGHE